MLRYAVPAVCALLCGCRLPPQPMAPIPPAPVSALDDQFYAGLGELRALEQHIKEIKAREIPGMATGVSDLVVDRRAHVYCAKVNGEDYCDAY